MHHPTDRLAHTMAFVTPVVEHWLEREIAQWVHHMKDRSEDPSHHERTPLPRSYISLPIKYQVFDNCWAFNSGSQIQLITDYVILICSLYVYCLILIFKYFSRGMKLNFFIGGVEEIIIIFKICNNNNNNPVSSKSSTTVFLFICIIPRLLLHQLWITGWNEK